MTRRVPSNWLVVTERKDANGKIHEELHVIDGPNLPWRISRRHVKGLRMAIEYVRSIPVRKPWDDEGVLAVSVTDGKRVLASHRHMKTYQGYTGTHEIHPLVIEHLKGKK